MSIENKLGTMMFGIRRFYDMTVFWIESEATCGRHENPKAFWKASIFPNCPKICILLSKKFPEHHSKLQLERANKVASDASNDQAEVHLQSMEPLIQVRSLHY
ncbi:hypothetical protein Tco_0773427 [Tanacetum coccineum]|uniref:Uncharacterized protein n=1 Tax=Tanacetum coccineum TaxID=301880 RepID=A0ABQ4ZMZ3_9ASTR